MFSAPATSRKLSVINRPFFPLGRASPSMIGCEELGTVETSVRVGNLFTAGENSLFAGRGFQSSVQSKLDPALHQDLLSEYRELL